MTASPATPFAAVRFAVLAAAVCATCFGGCSGRVKHPVPPAELLTTEVRALRVPSAPLDDPTASAWAGAPETTLSMQPQTIAYPMLPALVVPELRVRALTDDHWLAVRLEWADATASDALDVDQFTDAVAVELPLGNPQATSPMMGDEKNPVYIAHWKAVWQHDVDRGHWDVQDGQPGYWADTYPFASGGHPYPVEDAFQAANARRYLVGVSADNPVSSLHRRWPVEELHAHGFGSLANQQFQDARGRGVWRDGRWSVVLAIPREAQDPANPTLAAGEQQLAFAVWEGGAHNVAGRKQWFPFMRLVIP